MNAEETTRKYQHASRLYQERRYEESLAILDGLAIELPNDKNLLYTRTLCLAALGRTTEARSLCNQLISLHNDPRAEQFKAALDARQETAGAQGRVRTNGSVPFAAVWEQAWRRRWFRVEAIGTPLLVVLAGALSGVVAIYVEARKGVPLPDPVLIRFGPWDLTYVIFGTLWVCFCLAVFYLAREPWRLLMVFQAGAIVVILRCITLMLVPLDPLPTIIPLTDPFVMHFVTRKMITRDLFFSGHVSVVFMLFLSARKRWLRMLLLLGSIIVGAGTVFQHVHYTIDVLVAPFMTYACWRMVYVFHERWVAGSSTTPATTWWTGSSGL